MNFDLYRAERRTLDRALVVAIWVVRAYVLTKCRAGDACRRIGGK